MASVAANATVSSGTCASYWGRGRLATQQRSCYDCVNFEIRNFGGNPEDCMIDTNGRCIDRNGNTSAFALAQRNRTYCELDDAACSACLKSKPANFVGLCDGANNCFCTQQCLSPVSAFEDDSDFKSIGFMVAGGVIGLAVIGMILCQLRRKSCCKTKATYRDVGSGYAIDGSDQQHQSFGGAPPFPNSDAVDQRGYQQPYVPNAIPYATAVPLAPSAPPLEPNGGSTVTQASRYAVV